MTTTTSQEATARKPRPARTPKPEVEATAKINRKEFGIDFNAPLKTGGVLVSEEIKIDLEVSAIKQ